MNNALGRGLLNGWQLSGISSMASGIPFRLGFTGAAANGNIAAAYFGTTDVVGPTVGRGNGHPRLDGSNAGEKLLDINCISVPAFGTNGDLVPKYDLRQPTRQNHDVTLFKNFAIKGDQKIQFRVGFFNIFNQAFATTAVNASDINLTLDTTCNVIRNGIPDGTGTPRDNVCDPTGGFSFTPQTVQNFGKINLKRGRRVIEFVLKYYF
jgi:hypothetical protein